MPPQRRSKWAFPDRGVMCAGSDEWSHVRRCFDCKDRLLFYGDAGAVRSGGSASMAHGERRRRWWRALRSVEAGRELRAERPAVVAALGDWMRRHEVDALGFCRIGKGSTPAMRC